MKRSYDIHLKICLSKASEAKIVKVARRVYSDGNQVTDDSVEGSSRVIPAQEFIDCIASALMELVEQNPLFHKRGIEIEEISCTDPDHPEPESYGTTSTVISTELDSVAGRQDDDDDEYETGAYACRWPNGDFSIVAAECRRDAIFQLDEWGAAHSAWLIPLRDCMIDFKLNKVGEIELAKFGERTGGCIWERCYPKLDAILSRRDTLPLKAEIRKAVHHEQTRLSRNQPSGSEAHTELGKKIQRLADVAGPVADHYVRKAAKRILEAPFDKKQKPN